MDLIPLIDSLGETGAVLVVGILVGVAFGVFAQMSAFCTRSAVIETVRRLRGDALPVWLAGFATALLLVQLLLWAGWIQLAETRFFGIPQSLSGAAFGGLLFGVGMVLARGCVSRLIVLTGTGNLRALFSIVVVAIVAWATLFGPLTLARDAVAPLATTAATGGNELLVGIGAGHLAGAGVGAVLLLCALLLALRREASFWRLAGGVAVGATVAAGWFATHSLSTQLFDPVPVESVSLVRPLATSVTALWAMEMPYGIDIPLFLGILAGALVASLLSGAFRVQTFAEPGVPSVWRYGAGAALMGFGGVLAAGCTVGAGLTGGSILAISALLAFTGMVVGGVLADRLLDADRPLFVRRAAGPRP